MQNDDLNLLLPKWQNELLLSLCDNKSYGIALFADNGELICINSAMSSLCADFNSSSLFNPTFEKLLALDPADSPVYSGFLTIGSYNNINTSIEAKVYRKGSQLLITGGIDVSNLIGQNKTMHLLNLKVTNLQRQLLQEKAELKRTLKELTETQQKLIHSEKMNALGKLVAGVAHELNNPIAFVYSNLFTLEKYIKEVFDTFREYESAIELTENLQFTEIIKQLREKNDLDFLEEDISDMTKESKAGIERVKDIVEDLRRFSRLDESDIKRVDLVENIRSTISIIRAEISSKNIDFKFDGPGNLAIDCFPGQLNQALLNVLINAIQAVEPGGKVSMSVFEEVDNIVMEVKDNGIGIPQEIKNRIFEPFYTTKPVGSGTGLGLSITYKIIHDLHKGTIEVESSPGQGTKFKLSIPKKIEGHGFNSAEKQSK